MGSSGDAHPFDQDLSLKRVAPLRFQGHVTDNWSINGVPNGGYLMALLAHCGGVEAVAAFPSRFCRSWAERRHFSGPPRAIV